MGKSKGMPRPGVALVAAVLVLASGCMVGPDYVRPPAPAADHWLSSDPRLEGEGVETARWWHAFGDPALDALVETAYRQNLTLRAAGLRVIQAQARRGIAIGGLFPQTQALSGSASHTRSSLNGLNAIPGDRDFNLFRAGFDAAWELDFWGRFRRSIEAADADLLASLADYDQALVTLVGEVAATYTQVRVLEERRTIAHQNVGVQRDSLEVVRTRFEAGGTTDLDVQQATTLLEDTESTIPGLDIQLRAALDSLSVLLGVPPADFADVLAQSSGIPVAPPAVAVGIPAELLRRRPDVRRAERQVAAQSARIGVAVADLLPRFELTGSVGLSAEDAARFFEGRSFEGLGGARFDWPILNYGRLIGNVRVQDATFQELATAYADTVLRAQQEVEDSIVGYLRGTDQVTHLARSVEAADRAVELADIQYRGGSTDYTRVLTALQSKLQESDRLTSTRGAVALNVIALYKALGGGWELRDGQELVPAATTQEMRERTWWGRELDTRTQAKDVDAAASGTEQDRRPGPLRWRWWWPKWW